MSPTQRSLALLRSRGYLVAVVERWNSFVKRRQDLFGFIDLLAIKGDELIGVQSTSGSNVSARINKIIAEPNAIVWLSPSRKIVVHGWRKVGPRGKRKKWECREEEVT